MIFRGVTIGSFEVVQITDQQLVLSGGGDFYDSSTVSRPDSETWLRAENIAARCGMRITDAHGDGWGYSEMTPDPGDVSILIGGRW